MKAALRTLTLMLAAFLLLGWAMTAHGDDLPTITVDGATYEATQISGPTIHFETPDTNPSEAFTDRHVWEGHGSDNLPCEGGIHWIDNRNLLTISHCLLTTTSTTTTVIPTTTSTTAPPTTTTSEVETTTTTAGSSTTTTSGPEDTTSTTTVTSVPPSTSPPTTTAPPELPFTGPPAVEWLVALALMLMLSGGLLVRYRPR